LQQQLLILRPLLLLVQNLNVSERQALRRRIAQLAEADALPEPGAGDGSL
jgi:hypothetical protein